MVASSQVHIAIPEIACFLFAQKIGLPRVVMTSDFGEVGLHKRTRPD